MRRLLALPLLALAALSSALGVGDDAPPLNAKTLVRGSPVDLTKGLHVVSFWSSGFKPSTDAVPALVDLARRHRGKVDVTEVSVGERGDDPLAAVKKYVADQGAKMDLNVAYDADGAVAKGWLAPAAIDFMPAAFLVKDGKIVWIGDPAKGLDKAVDDTLKGTYDLAATKAAWDARMAAKAAEAEKAQQAQVAFMELMKPLVDAMQAHDPDAGLKAIDDIEAKRPDLKARLEPTRFAIFVDTESPKLLELANRFVAEDYKDDAITLNQLAWSIVDPKNEDPKPNFPVALVLAKRAAEASAMKDGQILDTYALALWKTGDKKLALETQTKAVELVSKDPEVSDESKKDIAGRLELFKKGL